MTPESDWSRVVDLISLIDGRPDVRAGTPCFVGTRITVYDVLFF